MGNWTESRKKDGSAESVTFLNHKETSAAVAMLANERKRLVARVLLPLATTTAHIVTAATGGYGLFRDELYFLACGERLGMGYADQPAGIAFIAKASRLLFGESLTGLRLMPAVAAGALVYVTMRLAAELDADRWQEMLAGVAAALAPVHVGVFGILTMNAFDFLLWGVSFWLTARALRTGDTKLWLWLGVAAGLALELKVSILFFGTGIMVGLIVARRWSDLHSPWLWLGILVAGVLCAPFALWQATHGWPLLDLMRASVEKNARHSLAEFLMAQLLYVNPVAVPLALAGLVALLWAPWNRPFRPLGIASVVVLAILALSPTSKPYLLGPAYPLLFAAGASALTRVRTEKYRRVLTISYTGLVLLSGIIIAPLAKPILPVDRYLAYSAALGISAPADERGAVGRLPQFFADRVGWPEIVATIADVYESLPSTERKKACIVVDNYGEAAAVEFFGRAQNLPHVISGHNHYWYWGPGDCTGEIAIVLSRDSGELTRVFAEVERAAAVECGDCMPYERHKSVWIARGLRVPIQQLWPSLRHII
jgi:hypothetical protein